MGRNGVAAVNDRGVKAGPERMTTLGRQGIVLTGTEDGARVAARPEHEAMVWLRTAVWPESERSAA